MTISVTWPNIYKLTGIIVAAMSLLLGIGSAILQREISSVDKHFEERLKIYQADQADIRHRIELIEAQLAKNRP